MAPSTRIAKASYRRKFQSLPELSFIELFLVSFQASRVHLQATAPVADAAPFISTVAQVLWMHLGAGTRWAVLVTGITAPKIISGGCIQFGVADVVPTKSSVWTTERGIRLPETGVGRIAD